MDVGKRIKERRKELGLSAEQVAERLNVSPSTIYRYESQDIKNMGIEKIAPIAKVLQTTPGYLMGWEESSTDQPEADRKPSLPKEHGEISADDAVPYNPTHRIPILGRISAGQPLYADEHIEGYTYTELNHGQEYFALRVHGDSMNALGIHEGYLVIVRCQEFADPGDIAVVMVGDDDEATMKRYYQDGDIVTLMPQSTNPEHKPQIYDARKTHIQVIGKVIEVKFTVR